MQDLSTSGPQNLVANSETALNTNPEKATCSWNNIFKGNLQTVHFCENKIIRDVIRPDKEIHTHNIQSSDDH